MLKSITTFSKGQLLVVTGPASFPWSAGFVVHSNTKKDTLEEGVASTKIKPINGNTRISTLEQGTSKCWGVLWPPNENCVVVGDVSIVKDLK